MDIPPAIEKKVWGEAQHLLFSGNVAISHLKVKKNTFCSVHRHLQRANHFMLLSGEVRVLLYGDGEEPLLGPLDVVFLPINYLFQVRAYVWHQFQVDADGEMIEIYTPDPASGEVMFEDIDRRKLGGTKE